jgi:hypothetical protein
MTMTTRERCEPWAVPVTALVLGLVALVAFGIGGQWWVGVESLVIMVGYAVILLMGRRFETMAVLGGHELDERRRAIGMQAAASTGYVLIAVVVGASFWNAANGGDGQPWGGLGALAGLTYIASVVVLRRRR